MSFSFIKEILGMPPAPFKWLDSIRCIFSIDDQPYGIFVEELTVQHKYSLVNISFGRISGKFIDQKNLDLTLSGAGNPRTVLSTVGAACIENHSVLNADIICLAATDEHSLRRSPLYSIAASEIRQAAPGFASSQMHMVKTATGSLLTLLIKRGIDQNSKDEIVATLNLTKLD